VSVAPDERLIDALGAIAEQVEVAPDAYERAQAEWRSRERRRRILAIVIAVLIIPAADVARVWALNRAKSGSPVIFDGPAPARVDTPPR
jgi:hypothetical protein